MLLRQLRWKLFISHALIVLIAIGVFVPTAAFLTNNPIVLRDDSQLLPGTVATGDTVSAATSGQNQLRTAIDDAVLIAAFAAVTGAIVVSWFVSRRVVEPLQELTQVSGRLATGYFRERTTLRSDDELVMLSQSINLLAENLEQTEQRRLGLIADVAHELRTPLTTIEGYMEGLIDDVIKPEPQLFALIHHEATRLKWMIEEMALLSRAEAGQLRVEPRPVDLGAVIANAAAQFQPQCLDKGLTLAVELAPDLPPALADPDRVEQILINLIANAMQYTPSGGHIRVSAFAADAGIRVTVADTGIGIPAEHLPHIFERFYRVDKSRARTSGGAGIGLTIARHLVYAHGGEIWAESEGNSKGTRLNFTLPVIEPVLV